MKFNLKFQDLKPEVKAEIHNEVMERIAGGKPAYHIPDEYFGEVSGLAGEVIRRGIKIIAEVDVEGELMDMAEEDRIEEEKRKKKAEKLEQKEEK